MLPPLREKPFNDYVGEIWGHITREVCLTKVLSQIYLSASVRAVLVVKHASGKSWPPYGIAQNRAKIQKIPQIHSFPKHAT